MRIVIEAEGKDALAVIEALSKWDVSVISTPASGVTETVDEIPAAADALTPAQKAANTRAANKAKKAEEASIEAAAERAAAAQGEEEDAAEAAANAPEPEPMEAAIREQRLKELRGREDSGTSHPFSDVPETGGKHGLGL